MVCNPAVKVDVVNVAIPPAKSPVPSAPLPFLKVIFSPSGGAPALELTVAVNSTDCPYIDVGVKDVTTMLVLFFTTFTFCLTVP
jgi:hypothetical protein